MGHHGVYADFDQLNVSAHSVELSYDRLKDAQQEMSIIGSDTENIFGDLPIAKFFHERLYSAHQQYHRAINNYVNNTGQLCDAIRLLTHTLHDAEQHNTQLVDRQ